MLAIVIPYYKRTYFKTTLEALANQTHQGFKVYIGDDASPECPLALLEALQGKLDFTYKRFDENLGGKSLAKQWKRCIDLSNDEAFLMILGDDDFPDSNFVQSWYDHQNNIKGISKLVRFASRIVYDDHESEVYKHPRLESATDSFLRKFKHETRSSLSEYIFSRAAYDKFGFQDYPLAWNSDDHAWLEFSDGLPIYSINESVMNVRISKLNISGKEDNLLLKKTSGIQFYKYLIDNHLSVYPLEQRFKFLRFYENEILGLRSLKYSEWWQLCYLYAINFQTQNFIKFGKRFVNHILRRHAS